MKKLILMVSLLAPVHAFANTCNGDDHVDVKYVISNQSGYGIILNFDEAERGDNPDSAIDLAPHQGDEIAIGCSSGFLTGYKTRATLRAYRGRSEFDLAYLYIEAGFSGAGKFLYGAFNTTSPECSCKLGIGYSWDGERMDFYDCSSFDKSTKKRMWIHISCK